LIKLKRRTAFILIRNLCKIIKVFTVTFDELNAPLLNNVLNGRAHNEMSSNCAWYLSVLPGVSPGMISATAVADRPPCAA